MTKKPIIIGTILLFILSFGGCIETPSKENKLTETGNWDDKNAFQGVAIDDTYFYTIYGHSGNDNNWIYKLWRSNGTLKQSQWYSKADDLDGYYFDDGNIINGALYITATNHHNYPPSGKIFKFNSSDLSKMENWTLPEDHWPEGIDYHNGYFWVVYGDISEEHFNPPHISKYNDAFVLQQNYYGLTYELNNSGTYDNNSGGYQGLCWYGDDIILPVHGNNDMLDSASYNYSVVIDRYHFNGIRFEEVRRYTYNPDGNTPDDADQGVAYDSINDKFWFSQRNHPSAGKHSITICDFTG